MVLEGCDSSRRNLDLGSTSSHSEGGRRMSKITYWKCVDCNSMINDENIHENGMEFCYGCMNYNPEVVLAYD
jgi:hypothetical protein